MNHIGERIKKKRELLQLQLNDLAKKNKINVSAILESSLKAKLGL